MYSLIISEKNFKGDYFSALDDMQETAAEEFDLCVHHEVPEYVSIEIEFIRDTNKGTKDLRAVLHFDDDQYDEDQDAEDEDEPDFPVSPIAHTTGTDPINELLSQVGGLTGYKIVSYFALPLGG